MALKLASVEFHLSLHFAASTTHDDLSRNQLSYGKIIFTYHADEILRGFGNNILISANDCHTHCLSGINSNFCENLEENTSKR